MRRAVWRPGRTGPDWGWRGALASESGCPPRPLGPGVALSAPRARTCGGLFPPHARQALSLREAHPLGRRGSRLRSSPDSEGRGLLGP
jgi:hypothetical protein